MKPGAKHTVILGPVPCHDCGALVRLIGSVGLRRWVGADGTRHWCLERDRLRLGASA